MIVSKRVSLDNIEIINFEFGLKKITDKKSFIISASHIDFDFMPQTNNKDSSKHRAVFVIVSTEKCNLVDFKIEVSFEYSYLTDITEDQKHEYISFGLLPQIIAFLRGYLLATSPMFGIRVVLPFIDMGKTLTNKFDNHELVNKKKESDIKNKTTKI